MKRILILCIALLISIPECCTCTASSPLIEWNTTIPGKRQGYDIAITPDGGYLVLGHENDEPLLAKLNKTGYIEWIKNIETETKGESFTMAFTPDNGIVYAGIATQADSGINLIKTNMEGEIQWEKPVTGTKFYFPYYITVDPTGNILVTGNIDEKNDDIFLLKANASGDPIWMKQIRGDGAIYSNTVTASTDGYVISGYTESLNLSGVYVAKIDQQSTILWNTTVERSGLGNRVLDTGEAYIISGIGLIASLTYEGEIQWVKTYGYGYAYDAALTDRGVLVCGISRDDLFFMEVNMLGEELWRTTMSGQGETFANGVVVTNDDGIVLVGSTNDVDLLVLKVKRPEIIEPKDDQVEQEPVDVKSNYNPMWVVTLFLAIPILLLTLTRKPS